VYSGRILRMTLWRLILAFVALTFVGFGFAFISNPNEMAVMVSIVLPDAGARTDFRAMYGGLEFGFGVFLLLCAFRREFVRVGLFAGACALVAMATARTMGLILDGFTFLQFMIALSEWAGGALASWGALMAKPEADTVPPPLQDPTPDHDTPPAAA
jgi:hypothetical protein